MNKILHLGLGNFHKAHQAWYVEKLNQMLSNNERWEIYAFSMQRPYAAQEHARQHHRYEVMSVEGNDSDSTTVASITHSGFLGADYELLKKLACDPHMTLVTLTITEKGYVAGGIALKALELILRERARIGTPLTILSCDSLQSNGHKLEQLLRAHMGTSFPKFPITFPCSMVDRNVPAAEPHAPIKTERFTQWVIENNFAGTHPPLERVGVEFVKNVETWELMKLRLLDAGYSFLAYYGLNRGMEFVHEVVTDAEAKIQLTKLWDEIIPHLVLPDGLDANAYTDRLLTRFNNPLLPHRLVQIATDGNLKLEQQILPTLKLAREKEMPHEMLESVVKEWRTRFAVLEPSSHERSSNT